MDCIVFWDLKWCRNLLSLIICNVVIVVSVLQSSMLSTTTQWSTWIMCLNRRNPVGCPCLASGSCHLIDKDAVPESDLYTRCFTFLSWINEMWHEHWHLKRCLMLMVYWKSNDSKLNFHVTYGKYLQMCNNQMWRFYCLSQPVYSVLHLTKSGSFYVLFRHSSFCLLCS